MRRVDRVFVVQIVSLFFLFVLVMATILSIEISLMDVVRMVLVTLVVVTMSVICWKVQRLDTRFNKNCLGNE